MSFCGIFIVVGLAFGGFSVRAAWRDGVSTAWPQVSGQIVRSTVKNDSSGDGDDYKPDIAYRYTVDGQEFTGTCVSFSGNHIACSYDFADRYVRRNPVGAAVRVSYQPGQPTVATLEPGLTRRSFSGVVMGLFFVVAGAYTIWHYENRERFLSLEGHPFLRMLPPFVGFGVFFGVIYWLSKS